MPKSLKLQPKEAKPRMETRRAAAARAGARPNNDRLTVRQGEDEGVVIGDAGAGAEDLTTLICLDDGWREDGVDRALLLAVVPPLTSTFLDFTKKQFLLPCDQATIEGFLHLLTHNAIDDSHEPEPPHPKIQDLWHQGNICLGSIGHWVAGPKNVWHPRFYYRAESFEHYKDIHILCLRLGITCYNQMFRKLFEDSVKEWGLAVGWIAFIHSTKEDVDMENVAKESLKVFRGYDRNELEKWTAAERVEISDVYAKLEEVVERSTDAKGKIDWLMVSREFKLW